MLGVLPQLRRNPLRVFTAAAREYGDVVRLAAGPHRVYLLNHPDHIKRVLQDNHRGYRLTPFYEKLRPVFGEGLFTSEGERWRHQRQLIQPAFDRRRLAKLGPIITAVTARRLEHWEFCAARGRPLDIAQEMARLTLEIVAQGMFGTDLGDRADEASRAIPVLLETLVRRTMALSDLAERLPTQRNRRFRRALRAMEDIVHGIIEERRRGGGDRRDLLSRLLEARDQEGSTGMSETQLRDHVMTMLVSGHLTTGNALAWTSYLISRHPEAERRLRAELAEVLGGRAPTVDDLAKLGYTKMIIQEALRLFPPTWRLARQAIDDDEIGGYPIPAGSIVVFSPYLIHRHPGFWEEPEAFDPERFSRQRSAGRARFAYIPFGGGPRMCVGEPLAMMEMQLIVATLTQRFRLHLVPGHPVEPDPVVTLRPRYGMMMTLKEEPRPEHAGRRAQRRVAEGTDPD